MTGRRLVLGARTVDLTTGQIEPDGSTLRRLEMRLLEYLAQRPDTFVAYDELLREVWGYAAGARTRTIYSTVYRLRCAIELDPSEPRWLISSPGEGVCLRGAELLRQPAARAVGNARPPGDLFVGRELELGWLDADEPAVRVLWGPGGAGKTRLALEHARRAGPRFPGGAWVCDLTALRTTAEVTGALSKLLGDPVRSADQLGMLLDELEPALIVLDNHESLEEDLAPVLAGWVEQAPRARWVVTSTVPLGLPGELQIPLGPLPAEEAAELLAARIRLSDPRAAMSPPALSSLADLLDHLPLALEIAAPHAARLTVEGALETLRRSGDLVNDRRTAPERHRSLKGIARWSVERLPARERQAIEALAVFGAEFDLDDAAAVIGAEAPEAAEILAQLAAASLVRVVPVDPSDPAPSYTLYSTLRAVLPAPGPEVTRRYTDHFARKAASWLEPRGWLMLESMPSPSLLDAAQRLLDRPDHPQLGALLEVALRSATTESAQALVDRALSLPLPPEAQLPARLWLARAAFDRGRTQEGLAAYEGLSEAAASVGLLALAVQLDLHHGRHLMNSGQREHAEPLLERAERWRRELGRATPRIEHVLEIEVCSFQARLAGLSGRLPWAERALEAAERLGDALTIEYTRSLLADTLRTVGHARRAEQHLRMVLPSMLERRDRRRVAGEACLTLGRTLLDLQRPEEAVDWMTRAIELFSRARWIQPYALGHRALAWASLSDLDRAEEDAEEAVRRARQSGNPFMQVLLDGVAAEVSWASGRGDPEVAREIRERAMSLEATSTATIAAGMLVNFELSQGQPEAAMAALAPLLETDQTDHLPWVVEKRVELCWRMGMYDQALEGLSWLAECWQVQVAERARLGQAALRLQLGLPAEERPDPEGRQPWTMVQWGRLQKARGRPLPPELADVRVVGPDVLLLEALKAL
jgi:tetratricopeptide (TPR) repeat protein